MRIILLFICLFGVLEASIETPKKTLEEETAEILEKSLRYATQFYTLEEGEDLREITSAILDSADTFPSAKQHIVDTGRRFFLFRYLSDGLWIKGYISFVPEPTGNPLLIFLRGGNNLFGLLNPGSKYSCIKNYTILSTTYRGGVSEGVDEFGGADVNDVYNLLEYLPILEKKLSLSLAPKRTFMIGGSRGGMQMFLALSRFPSLQQRVDKIVSLSGMLDLRECLVTRPDQRKMFIRDFGLTAENEEGWIQQRDPIGVVEQIRQDLPILILQGTADLRVTLNQGYHMVSHLQETDHLATYMEFSEGNHCLGNVPGIIQLITDWLEQD